MSGLVKYVSSVYKAKSLGEILKRGVAWALLDGNVACVALGVSGTQLGVLAGDGRASIC